MTSIVEMAKAFQLEIQIQLIGSGLKEHYDQLTAFAMGMKEKSGLGKAFRKLVCSFWHHTCNLGHCPPGRQALLG